MSVVIIDKLIHVEGDYFGTVKTDIDGDIYLSNLSTFRSVTPIQLQEITDLLEEEQIKAEHIKESELQHERKQQLALANKAMIGVAK